jgi:DNA-binding transcriptional regulator YdaS (Cro superfamily)
MGHLVDMRLDRDPALMEVIRRYGNATALARSLGLSNQAVSAWEMVPPKYIRAISQATGIHPYRIRPDLYVEGFWNLGFDTVGIADQMRISEAEAERYLHMVLARRKAGTNDNACSALPPVSKPPLEGQ